MQKLSEREVSKLKLHLSNLYDTVGGMQGCVLGKALGDTPRFFVVGDYPVPKDYITGCPFSGSLQQILTKAVLTLSEKYGATHSDCYLTYLVKSNINLDSLEEKDFVENWLPILQLEYMLSGCEMVVAIGKKARLFAAAITQPPTFMKVKGPDFFDKVRSAWQILTT